MGDAGRRGWVGRAGRVVASASGARCSVQASAIPYVCWPGDLCVRSTSRPVPLTCRTVDGPSRTRALVTARQISMYLRSRLVLGPYSAPARSFGLWNTDGWFSGVFWPPAIVLGGIAVYGAILLYRSRGMDLNR